MNQSNTCIESPVTYAIDVLSEDLYSIIATAAWNIYEPKQIFQRKINRIGPWSKRSFNNKPFLETKEQVICNYIERLNL